MCGELPLQIREGRRRFVTENKKIAKGASGEAPSLSKQTTRWAAYPSSQVLFTECVGNHFRPQNNHAHYYHILFSHNVLFSLYFLYTKKHWNIHSPNALYLLPILLLYFFNIFYIRTWNLYIFISI